MDVMSRSGFEFSNCIHPIINLTNKISKKSNTDVNYYTRPVHASAAEYLLKHCGNKINYSE